MRRRHLPFEGGVAFRAVVGVVSLVWTVLGISYLTDPAGAVRNVSALNQRLGGGAIELPDVAPWRDVAAIGLLTLGLMGAMLLVDLRRNHPVVVPIVFFKAANALAWFRLAEPGGLPVLVAAGLVDLVAVAALAVVTWRAYRRLPAISPERGGTGRIGAPRATARPRPSDRPGRRAAMSGWRPFEQRWRDQLCRAAVPADEARATPGWGDLDRTAYWTHFATVAPASLRRGWRLAVWALTLAPLLKWPRPRPFGRLSPLERSRFLHDAVDHRWSTVRQAADGLLLVVAFGYVADADVRSDTVDGDADTGGHADPLDVGVVLVDRTTP